MLLSTNRRTLLDRIGAGDLVGVSNMLLDKPPLRKTRFNEVWQTTFCRNKLTAWRSWADCHCFEVAIIVLLLYGHISDVVCGTFVMSRPLPFSCISVAVVWFRPGLLKHGSQYLPACASVWREWMLMVSPLARQYDGNTPLHMAAMGKGHKAIGIIEHLVTSGMSKLTEKNSVWAFVRVASI
jgi:hypothetical protein